jgi:hypothetical protein
MSLTRTSAGTAARSEVGRSEIAWRHKGLFPLDDRPAGYFN